MPNKLNLFFEKKPILSFFLLACLLVSLQGFLSYCSKTYCPAFSDPYFNSWFPYKQGQVIYLYSSNNRHDSIVISSVYRSPASTTSGGCGKVACSAIDVVQSLYIDSASPYLSISYNIPSSSSGFKLVQVDVNQFVFNGTRIADSGIAVTALSSIQTSFSSILSLGGTNYADVELIQRDTTGLAPNSVVKIWLAKNIGLLAYERYPSGEIWVKQ